MRLLLVGALFACGVQTASAADDSVLGTHWVRYEPLQVGGQLQGCSLVYLAVQADRAYLNGNHVAANGSIQIRSTSSNRLGLFLKLGLKDLTNNTAFERPAFAYIQTSSGTTANATLESFDGDEGYKLFAYSATDPVIMKIVQDLMTNSNVTLGYNRKKDGIDVLVPLDLFIVDSDYLANQKVLRKSSPETATRFVDCVGKVINNVLGKLGEK